MNRSLLAAEAGISDIEDLNSGNRSPLPKSWSASIRTHGFL